LSNPTKLCYKGLNDGTAPECADRAAKYAQGPSAAQVRGRATSARKLREWQQRVFSPTQEMGKDKKMHYKLDMDAVARNSKNPTQTLAHLAKHSSNRVSKPYDLTKRRSKRAQQGGADHEEQEQEQHQGGRAVSLKTAVRLLRQYYNSKYN
jgi:hypothetical protein